MLIKWARKAAGRLRYLFMKYVLRDPLIITASRWFADRGDKTLRLDYNLNASSIVFDVGGYIGDYTEDIYRKFSCKIFLFEPVTIYYNKCLERFGSNSSITCLNYGLSSKSGTFEISQNGNQSSFKATKLKGKKHNAQTRSISEAVSGLGVTRIDLIKINIEGGEFDLLPTIIDSGLINQIKYIQIQFHNFDKNAASERGKIRKMLEKTHREMWNYDFLWESWELR